MELVGYVKSIFETENYVKYDITTLKNAFNFNLFTVKKRKDLKIGTVISFKVDYYDHVKSYELYDITKKERNAA